MRNEKDWKPWRDDELRMLGTDTDKMIAKELGRSLMAVAVKRWKRGVLPMKSDAIFVRESLHESVMGLRTLGLLGKYLDREIVEMTGLSVSRVRKLRKILKTPPARVPLEMKRRNQEIARERTTLGTTLADLGEKYGGFSKEWIRQICERENADGSQT